MQDPDNKAAYFGSVWPNEPIKKVVELCQKETDNLIEVLDSEYIFMAKLKGLSKSTVLIKHALPNAIIPTLNLTALNLGFLIGGVVIVEKIFTFPGFGNLLIDSIKFRDLPLVEATILIAAAFYIFANLLTDILSIIFNPKLRKQ